MRHPPITGLTSRETDSAFCKVSCAPLPAARRPRHASRRLPPEHDGQRSRQGRCDVNGRTIATERIPRTPTVTSAHQRTTLTNGARLGEESGPALPRTASRELSRHLGGECREAMNCNPVAEKGPVSRSSRGFTKRLQVMLYTPLGNVGRPECLEAVHLLGRFAEHNLDCAPLVEDLDVSLVNQDIGGLSAVCLADIDALAADDDVAA
jgi:hypothetical protein